MKLTIKDIAAVLGKSSSSNREISTLLTDSRSLCTPEATLFFALKTSVNDGHRYIADLYRRGVRAFVVERVPEVLSGVDDADFLIVPNPLVALQTLAAYVRSLVNIPVVGITGSRGKTIVKELVYTALLKAGKRVVRSPRSWNSQIGVPLSVWHIERDTEIAIFEAGIDHPGQMQVLHDIIRPTVGVMTFINGEHDAGFVDRATKVDEKRQLMTGCDKVIEGDDNRLVAGDILEALGESRDLLNGIDEVSTRLDVHDGVNDSLTIFDEFTADVPSLLSALDFMSRRKTASRRNTVILGDLLHRDGDDVRAVYSQAAAMLKMAGIDRLIGVGKEISSCADVFDPLTASEFMESTDEFLARYDVSRFDRELILIKGKRGVGFDAIMRRLESPRHQSILEVNLDAVVDNFNSFRALLKPQTGMVAMVKASGYGTGALELAKTLQGQGAAYLAVAVIEEGVALRRAGITMPIMVLNPVSTNYQALFSYNLEPAVFSIRELEMLINEAARFGLKNYPVHIKFDTGMHRVGFIDNEIDGLVALLKSTDSVKVASAFSHLATADCLDEDAYTESQFEAFDRLTASLSAGIAYPFKRHILNTAGIMRYPERQYDMVRLGIGLYGVSPLPPEATDITLRTVAKLSSTIISLKRWPAETTIGYSRRGVLTRESVIATVPIGYADGVDRHFGRGNAKFVVNGHLCPTVGNICMDLCMIDVTDANAEIGDLVEIFGPEAPIEALAETLGTIPYEILTSVSPRIHRIYFRE
ncbi:MAG: alanine racemase [Muribaculaceae bacterium]|nr:alanine racemase [Muribaculaceae bacterium]